MADGGSRIALKDVIRDFSFQRFGIAIRDPQNAIRIKVSTRTDDTELQQRLESFQR